MADAKTDEYEIRPQRVKTLDSKDYDLGWTNQAPHRPVEPEEMNPVTFTKDQLPNPAVMAEQGVPLASYLAHFGNVEGASVEDGVLVDEDSGDPLHESLDGDVEDVPGAPGTNPVAYSKNPALESPTEASPAPVGTVEPTKDKAAASKRAAKKA